MVVVSDTTAITYLLQISRLQILSQLFGNVIIPSAVYKELEAYHGTGIDKELGKFGIEVHSSNMVSPLKGLVRQQIDIGEEQAITLALMVKADILIIDEKVGRKIAKEFGLTIIGILGVLIQAKRMGYIESIKNVVDELRTNTSFRISENLYHSIIESDEQ